MIDPNVTKINIFSESKLSIDEIENLIQIKKQNSFLKKSFIVLVIVTSSIVIYNHFNTKVKDSK